MKRILIPAIFLVLSQCAQASDWPTFRGNYARTGEFVVDVPLNMSDFGVLWAFQTQGPVRSSPAISDIDGDGLKEIVFGSDDGFVYAVDFQGGLKWKYRTAGPVRSSPTVDSLFGDGKPDILIGSDDGNLYALDGSGRLIWNYSTGGQVRTSPALIVTDPQSYRRIVFGSDDGKIYGLDPHGKEEWSYETLDRVESSPAIADIDADGKSEIIIGSNDNIVYAMRYPPYKVWQYLTGGGVSATPAIDQDNRIIAASEDGRLYRLDVHDEGTISGGRGNEVSMSSLSPLWNFTAGEPIKISPAAGRAMPSKGYCIIVGSDRDVHFVNPDGTANKTYTVSKSMESSPALADLDADGQDEVIFGSNDGRFYIIDYPGTQVYSQDMGAAIRSSPAIADLTSNGIPEIAVGSDDGKLYLFGERMAKVIDQADALYLKALSLRAIGQTDDGVQATEQAKGIYAENRQANGVDKCNNLLETIDADKLLQGARKQYENKHYDDAEDQLTKAANLYVEANHTAGIEAANNLYRKVEAEKYFLEGKYYLDNGMIYNASAYLEAAMNFYRILNDSEGLLKCQNMSTTAKARNNAIYYNDDLNAPNVTAHNAERSLNGSGYHAGFAKANKPYGIFAETQTASAPSNSGTSNTRNMIIATLIILVAAIMFRKHLRTR